MEPAEVRYWVGPIVAAYILGHVANPARFATPQRFAGVPPVSRTPSVCG
jgi:hypothetical protein